MIQFLIIGALLGFSAGFSPGPLLALVISETVQYGVRSGIKVALAPLFSDLPIIFLTLFIISKISAYHWMLGAISIAGGIFILITGYQGIRTKAVEISIQARPSRSLLKGITANLLNPHPYLFWISVGGPTISRAMHLGTGALVAFIGGFYITLTGAKILLALAVGSSRSFLSGKLYCYVMRLLGVLLCFFALTLFGDGIKLLGLTLFHT